MMKFNLSLLLSLMFFVFDLKAQILKTASQDNALLKYDLYNSTSPGLCREIVNEVMKVDPSLKFSGLSKAIPLPRIEEFLQYSKIDVFFCMLKTDDRLKKFNFIDIPLYSVNHVLVMKDSDDTLLKTDLSLKEISQLGIILVNQGSALIRDLESQGVKFQAGAKDDRQILEMIEKKRGRFYYAQDMTIRYLLKREKLKEKYIIYPKIFKTEHQLIAYSKKLDQKMVQKIGLALKQLQDKGMLKAIYKKYVNNKILFDDRFIVLSNSDY